MVLTMLVAKGLRGGHLLPDLVGGVLGAGVVARTFGVQKQDIACVVITHRFTAVHDVLGLLGLCGFKLGHGGWIDQLFAPRSSAMGPSGVLDHRITIVLML